MGEDGDPPFHRLGEGARILGAGQPDQRQRHRERVLGAVIHLPREHRLVLLGPLARSDVAGDRQMREGSVGELEGRGVGLHAPAGASQADNVELPAQRLAAANPLVVPAPRRPMLGRDQVEDAFAFGLRPTLGFDRAEAGFVHLQQRAVRRYELDAFRSGIENGAQLRLAAGQGRLGRPAVGDVDQHVHGADQRSRRVAHRRRVGNERDARAVGTLRDRVHATHRPPFGDRHRHRARLVRHGRAVRTEEPPGPAPARIAKARPPAPEGCGGLVVGGEPALGIGGVDGDAQRLQQSGPRVCRRCWRGFIQAGQLVKAQGREPLTILTTDGRGLYAFRCRGAHADRGKTSRHHP
ncbi:MAG TPA: hypothetical protein VEX11_07240 [Acetobacteraceae bacterium]|nr:hypothetical protein [Acetobacteraceae bacterium]